MLDMLKKEKPTLRQKPKGLASLTIKTNIMDIEILKALKDLRDSVDEKLEPELAKSVKDAISQITGMLN
jgi:hypothetical protein